MHKNYLGVQDFPKRGINQTPIVRVIEPSIIKTCGYASVDFIMKSCIFTTKMIKKNIFLNIYSYNEDAIPPVLFKKINK